MPIGDEFDEDFDPSDRTRGIRRRPPARYNDSNGDGGTAEDRVFRLYGIPTATPKRERVERLLLLNIEELDIAELLNMGAFEIKQIVKQVEDKWRTLGAPLENADRTLQRGKAIRGLEVIKSQIAKSDDSRAQGLLLQVEQQLIKLRALDVAKSEDAPAEKPDIIREALGELTPDKLALIKELIKT